MTTKSKINRWRLKFTRDASLRVVGFLGILHETFWTTGERPTLLLLFAYMFGLPSFLHVDEESNNKP